MKFNSFEDYFNTLKKRVSKICLGYSNGQRIEYDDLFNEASLKLLYNYKNGTEFGINYSLEIIQNHLINYIRSKRKDREISVGDFDKFFYIEEKKDSPDYEINKNDPNNGKTEYDKLKEEINELSILFECKRCGKEFIRKRMDQIYCSIDCVKIYRSKIRAMQAKYGDEFTNWLKGR